MERTQKDVVRDLLFERGEAGVGAHELTYQHGITRAAAIIHTLRHEERMNIETKQEPGHQAVYILHRGPVQPKPPEVAGQTPMLPDEQLPTISWDELRDRFAAERADPRRTAR